MHLVALDREDDFDAWRAAARSLVAARVPADRVVWQVGRQASDLFADRPVVPSGEASFAVSREFLEIASKVVLHSHPERFSLLYALLLRVIERPGLMKDRADPLVRRVTELFDTIRRDLHKMHAFVRFREVDDGGQPRFVAWFEPEHHILRYNAGFFVGRFANMHWSILTPRGSVHWDGSTLTEGPGATRGDAPGDDPVEDIWKAYYAAIFNPARLMTGAMLKEMPKKYWKNMPETVLVKELVAGARKRELDMINAASPARSKDSVAASGSA